MGSPSGKNLRRASDNPGGEIVSVREFSVIGRYTSSRVEPAGCLWYNTLTARREWGGFAGVFFGLSGGKTVGNVGFSFYSFDTPGLDRMM